MQSLRLQQRVNKRPAALSIITENMKVNVTVYRAMELRRYSKSISLAGIDFDLRF